MTPYYSHAGITIYHADCRDILPHLEPVDIVHVDPPFGIGFAAEPTKWQRRKGAKGEDWDDQPIENLPDLLAIGKIQIVWGGNYYPLVPSRGWLCWAKPDAPPSMGSFELAWTNQDRNSRLITHSISATNKERCGHPTQKPLAVVKWALAQFDGSSIADPFMGSGTTLVAAKDLGSTAVGIEINEAYCEMAARRLSQECFQF